MATATAATVAMLQGTYYFITQNIVLDVAAVVNSLSSLFTFRNFFKPWSYKTKTLLDFILKVAVNKDVKVSLKIVLRFTWWSTCILQVWADKAFKRSQFFSSFASGKNIPFSIVTALRILTDVVISKDSLIMFIKYGKDLFLSTVSYTMR